MPDSNQGGLTSEQRDAVFALGLFVLAWSGVEGTLECAISKQLNLVPLDGSIVTAGLQFKARAATLRGLLNRDPVANAAALKTLGKLQTMPDRNDLLHGLAGSNEHGLVFTRRKSDGKFTSQDKEYSTVKLLQLSVEVTDLARHL